MGLSGQLVFWFRMLSLQGKLCTGMLSKFFRVRCLENCSASGLAPVTIQTDRHIDVRFEHKRVRRYCFDLNCLMEISIGVSVGEAKLYRPSCSNFQMPNLCRFQLVMIDPDWSFGCFDENRIYPTCLCFE
jgi:hypothetical protein